MKQILLCLLRACVLVFLIAKANGQTAKQPVDYVNPFIGASTSEKAAGNFAGLGKTYPGAVVPFGMVQLSPNTITGGDNGSGYSYEHTTIEGFALTQMSGVGWYGDLGNFLVMPATGVLKTAAGTEGKTSGYRSSYSKQTEKASAGYYSADLTDYRIKAEMTAALHSGMMRFTFPEHRQSRIQIDLARRVGGTSTFQCVRIVDDHTIEGYMICPPEGGGWGNGDGHADYKVYFYAQFSKPFTKTGIWSANIPDNWTRKRDDVPGQVYQDSVAHAAVFTELKEDSGKHLGFFTEFASRQGEQVLLRAAISFNSVAGARANLEKEINDWDFDRLHLQARTKWNEALSKITVEGGTEDQKFSFYTALYHTMLDPRTFEDADGQYLGGDKKIHKAEGFTKRTIFSGWDVFRSQMPLQTLINPFVVTDLINSQTTLAKESGKGYYERWEFLNAYSGCMIGNPLVSVVTDAYQKGLRNFDTSEAFQTVLRTENLFGNGDRGFSGPPQSISHTLEYAYTNWCTAQLAKGLGTPAQVNWFSEHAMDYKNVFDTSVSWFRPRTEDGAWEAWPEKGRLTEGYGTVESNPYQQGWFVPQDVPGLVNLLGGKQKAIAELTTFFDKAPQNMLWNLYYNHSNEPVHHVVYLFNRFGAPWLTQKWSRAVCDRAYHNSVEGLVGNEDVGQMSAWFVLAATGIAQICPGDLRYEISSPLFDKTVIRVSADGKTIKPFTISALNNSPQNIYIQSATLNGKRLTRCYLRYAEISHGGTLQLTMGKEPNLKWSDSQE